MIGQKISHYKIIEKIGAGGMGEVYKAMDTKLDRTVALKFLPQHLSLNTQEKKRFIHEAKAAAALDHLNICNIFEIDETEDGQMFIAMGYYQGQTLKDKIEQRPLSIDEAIDITIQIAEGLNQAHKKDIIHRDIKSANIMVTNDGIVKILDFGLAKLRGVTKLTKEGTTLGTVSYMSPEQASGEKTDRRSDIWSLGVLLYEMITGQIPFKGEYEQAIMYAILNENPEPPSALRSGVPLVFDQIITKLLAKDPGQRYQHLDDLIVDLRKVREDSKPGEESAKLETKPVKKFQISQQAILVPGIVVLIGIVVAAFFLLRNGEQPSIPAPIPSGKPTLAVLHFNNLTGDNTLDHWRSGFLELLITDLSQSKFLDVLRSGQITDILKNLNLNHGEDYSEEQIQKIAQAGKIDHILRGSYLKAGNQFVITAMLQDMARGKLVITKKFIANGEEQIFVQIDNLTREIKTQLKFSQKQIQDDIDEEINKITTSSPQAYELFIKGIEFYRRAEPEKAIPLFKNAIEIDPEFALAYLWTANLYGNMGITGEPNKKLKRKAFELRDRLSTRERYLVEGAFYQSNEKTFDKAIISYRKLLELYPDDNTANRSLGNVYFLLEDFNNALDPWERNLNGRAPMWSDYYNAAELYIITGRADKGLQLLKDFEENQPDNFAVNRGIIRYYISQNRFNLAQEKNAKGILKWPDDPRIYHQKGRILQLKGEWESAEATYLNLINGETDSEKYWGRYGLAYLNLTLGRYRKSQMEFQEVIRLAEKFGATVPQMWFKRSLIEIFIKTGQWQKALSECDNAWKDAAESLRERIRITFLRGVTYINRREFDFAKKMAKDLKNQILESHYKKEIRLYHLLRGILELNSGEYNKALSTLEEAWGSMPPQIHSYPLSFGYEHAIFLDPLAEAYKKRGNWEKAKEYYQKITKLNFGRLHHGDIYAMAFFNLGKINQRLGDKEHAVKSYKKFIKIWENCDPEFRHLVDDAREQVRKIEGQI